VAAAKGQKEIHQYVKDIGPLLSAKDTKIVKESQYVDEKTRKINGIMDEISANPPGGGFGISIHN